MGVEIDESAPRRPRAVRGERDAPLKIRLPAEVALRAMLQVRDGRSALRTLRR